MAASGALAGRGRRQPRGWWRPLLWTLALTAVAVGLHAARSLGPAEAVRLVEPTRLAPTRPSPCTTVASGASLRAAVEAARDKALCLEAGRYTGPLEIRHPLTLWGPPEAVVRSGGTGTTIAVSAANTKLLGFTVDGSGSRFDTLDAAVRVRADDVVVAGLEIRRAVFGLLVEKSNRVVLRGNVVHGTEEGPLGLRGDPIRLWETRDSRIEGNRVLAGRDVVIWYSSNNRIIGNLVEHGRYGTHLMYSHGNRIAGNRYEHNVVGTFVMYSRNVHLRNNLFLHSSGAGGMGLGLKESGNLTVRDNAFIHNQIGVYVDTSPLDLADQNRFEGNRFAFGQAGVVFHGSETRNTFQANSFVDNADQVRVEGNADATGVVWRGNHFDDYQGYDLDDDGHGDVPYELRSLSSDLVQRAPALAFLRGTPALWLVDAAAHVAPLFAPRLLLVDPEPRIDPPPLLPERVGHAD